MSNRVILRRAKRIQTTDQTADFSSDQPQRISLVKPIAASAVVAILGVGIAGGTLLASASSSTEQNQSSLIVDANTPDQSKAVPIDSTLTAEQIQAQKSDETSQNTTAGGLEVFGQRGTTVNRSSVRSAIDSTLTAGDAGTRATQLKGSSTEVEKAQAKAEQLKREQQMEADIKKVKAEAARIEEEKRKAAEELKRQQELAAAQAAANGGTPGATPPGSTTPGAPAGPSQADLSTLVSGGGGALPLPAGRATLGAHFGQYGSWSKWHTGQDFPAATGTPIYAVADGVVLNSTGAGGWAGNYVVVYHANGGSTLYAHMSSKVAMPGQTVKAGQLIGYVGTTGRTFGAHLHLEYYPPGTTPGDVYRATDPLAFMRSLGVKI